MHELVIVAKTSGLSSRARVRTPKGSSFVCLAIQFSLESIVIVHEQQTSRLIFHQSLSCTWRLCSCQLDGIPIDDTVSPPARREAESPSLEPINRLLSIPQTSYIHARPLRTFRTSLGFSSSPFRIPFATAHHIETFHSPLAAKLVTNRSSTSQSSRLISFRHGQCESDQPCAGAGTCWSLTFTPS